MRVTGKMLSLLSVWLLFVSVAGANHFFGGHSEPHKMSPEEQKLVIKRDALNARIELLRGKYNPDQKLVQELNTMGNKLRIKMMKIKEGPEARKLDEQIERLNSEMRKIREQRATLMRKYKMSAKEQQELDKLHAEWADLGDKTEYAKFPDMGKNMPEIRKLRQEKKEVQRRLNRLRMPGKPMLGRPGHGLAPGGHLIGGKAGLPPKK